MNKKPFLEQMANIGSEVYRELTRMRWIWVDYFKYENQYNSTDEDINKYFMYLTIALKNISAYRIYRFGIDNEKGISNI